MRERDGEARREGAQSIARAFRLMRLVATGRDAGLGLSDIARLAALTRPTVHRILAALVAEGVVERRPKSRRYVLGQEVQHLALARTTRSALVRLAEPRLAEAAGLIGDTLFLTLRTGFDTICVGRRLGTFPIQVLVLDVGDRRPLGVSSAGLAILSCLPQPEAAAILDGNAARLAAHGSDTERALAAVARTRELGYALRAPGLVPGTRALSVPIRATGGAAVGALTVAAISRRLGSGRVDAVLDALTPVAASFELALARESRAA